MTLCSMSSQISLLQCWIPPFDHRFISHGTTFSILSTLCMHNSRILKFWPRPSQWCNNIILLYYICLFPSLFIVKINTCRRGCVSSHANHEAEDSLWVKNEQNCRFGHFNSPFKLFTCTCIVYSCYSQGEQQASKHSPPPPKIKHWCLTYIIEYWRPK